MEKLITKSENGVMEMQRDASGIDEIEKYRVMEEELNLYKEKQNIAAGKSKIQKYNLMEEEKVVN